MANGTTAQKDSYRVMFKFWLDHAKDADLLLSDFCEQMKNERRFTQTIRDGLTLIRDLRAGKVDSLIRMFPAIVELLKHNTPDDTPPSGGEGSGDKFASLEEKLDFLILSYGTGNKGLVAAAKEHQLAQHPGIMPPSKPRQLTTSAGNRALTSAPADLPDFEVMQAAQPKGTAFANYMRSLSGMSSAPVVEPKPAQRRASKPRKQRQRLAPVLTTSEQDTRPIAPISEALEPGHALTSAGANVQFNAPSFDDLPVDF